MRNIYDNSEFFAAYAEMGRSKDGLKAAGQRVIKQHHTLTQILNPLIKCGFQIEAIEEAMPPADMMGMPGMCNEMRRPMMLLVKVKKV